MLNNVDEGGGENRVMYRLHEERGAHVQCCTATACHSSPVGVGHANKAKLLAVVVAQVLCPFAQMQHDHGGVKEKLGHKITPSGRIERVAADAGEFHVGGHGVAVDVKRVAGERAAACVCVCIMR